MQIANNTESSHINVITCPNAKYLLQIEQPQDDQ